jgi:hypothetical protein
MLQPHHSKLSHQELSHLHRQMLPTGNSFAGSNLLRTLPSKRFTPNEFASRFVSIVQELSELSIQLFSLIVVTIWFWCLLAAVRIAFGWDRKIDLTFRKPERVPFMGTLTS